MKKKNIGILLSALAATGIIVYAMPSNPPAPQTGGGLMAPPKPTPVAIPYTSAPGSMPTPQIPNQQAGQPTQQNQSFSPSSSMPSQPIGGAFSGTPSSSFTAPSFGTPSSALSFSQPAMQSPALKKTDVIMTEIKSKLSQPDQDIANLIMQQAQAIEKVVNKSDIKKELLQEEANQEAELVKATEQYKKNFSGDKFTPKNWGELLTSVKRINTATTLLDATKTFLSKVR